MNRIGKHFSWVPAIVLAAGFMAFSANRALAESRGAQTGAAKTPPTAAGSAQTPGAPPSSQSPAAETPAPGKKETQSYKLSPEKYEKAVEYSRAGYRLYFIDFVYGLAVLWVILRFGMATKFRDWAESASGARLVQVVIFAPLLMLTSAILELPTSIYGHSLSLKYEQSIQRWGSWFWDWTKGQIIGLIIGTLLIWILYGVIRRSPRRWWFYFWLSALPILLFILFISPVVIDPLFNKFEPLDKSHPDLVTAIEGVVHRAGMDIPRERMFLMVASLKTNQINAYVTGFGTSKRVVVLDTTIKDMATPETLFVFGHEMGHYVLHHVRNGFIFIAGLLLVVFFLGFHAIHWALGRWGSAWKIRGPEDWASLPVFLLVLSVILFLSSPVFNGFSRYQEHQADIYGLEVTHGLFPNSSEVAAHAFQVLGEVDLSDPNPSEFITVWLYSHPPLADRLVFAHTYDPWGKGEPPQFVK
jgi:STE24 endopeptidase